MAILVDTRHAARRPGADGLGGSLPRASQPLARDERRGWRYPGQGRAGRRGHPCLRHGRLGGDRDRRQHRDGLRSRPRSPPTRCMRRSTPASGPSSASPRAFPRTRCCASTPSSTGRDVRAHRAELPGRALAGEGERRDHPGGDLPRGGDRARLALGDAHVPDRPRAHAARARQLDDRRDRRRPRRRLVVPRDPRPVRGRSADGAGRHGRGDRRRRGGEGRRVHRVRDDEAGRRLYRRVHRAARKDDGARRRDHLRLGRAPRRRRRKRSRRRASVSARRRPRPRSSSPRSPRQ